MTNEVRYMTADEEDYIITQANEPLDENHWFVDERVTSCRGMVEIDRNQIDYMDVAPSSWSPWLSAMIPFRKTMTPTAPLMGANMQRQAVPLLTTDAPVVGTGIEYSRPRFRRVHVLAATKHHREGLSPTRSWCDGRRR